MKKKDENKNGWLLTGDEVSWVDGGGGLGSSGEHRVVLEWGCSLFYIGKSSAKYSSGKNREVGQVL